jgi:adenosylhomocysteinase
LSDAAVSRRKVRDNIEEYVLSDGRKVYLLAEGRLVNLAAGDGHPAEIMDMTFALQALSLKFINENYTHLSNKVYEVPEEIDKKVAEMKLETLGVKIDRLTQEQKEYLACWKE